MAFDNLSSAPEMAANYSQSELEQSFRRAMTRVYLWMGLGLLLTTIASAVTLSTPPLLELLISNPGIYWGLFIVELLLVFAVSGAAYRLSPGIAAGIFLFYAALNGVTISMIFLAYTAGSIALTFLAATSLFAAMGIIGLTTKRVFDNIGGYVMMAVIGFFIALVLNIFLQSTALEWIISVVGVVLFMGLTIYHTERTRRATYAAVASGDTLAVRRIGITAALALYLDFINLFLMLLRIMGDRR